MIRRRQFITLLGGAAAAWPLAVRAQQRERVRQIGYLHSASRSQFVDAAFRQGLQTMGFVEGQNVTIEGRWAQGAFDQLPRLAAELVGMHVELIAAAGTPAVRVAKAASVKAVPNIPVVFVMGGDPVAEGIVESLNRPGENITGITTVSAALTPKRLELVREFLRDGAPIAFLLNPASSLSEPDRKDAEAAAAAIGQKLEILTASNQAEIERAFATLTQRKFSVLIIAADLYFYSQMQRMATLAVQTNVPTIGPLREFAVDGGLLSYGASIPELNRQVGVLVGRVLNGARPADLPVQQPTKFELVINLKTAKALGVTVPPALLARADEVIE
jgi:putative tryptophan/tyrosine transport system substrate-binding protein